MSSPSYGVGIVTYNRARHLHDLIDAVIKTVPGARVVIADDGSTDETPEIVAGFREVTYLRGPNKGVAHNKNRALAALQQCDFVALLEDDLKPIRAAWMDVYATAAAFLGIHHFCRVQEKEVPETLPDVTEALGRAYGWTPLYGPSPRGDLTVVTRKAIQAVGGLHPSFIGAGYAHGEWSGRIERAGLIGHPLKWVDIDVARDSFVQVGDTEGGRFLEDPEKIKAQLARNRAVAKALRMKGGAGYVPLEVG